MIQAENTGTVARGSSVPGLLKEQGKRGPDEKKHHVRKWDHKADIQGLAGHGVLQLLLQVQGTPLEVLEQHRDTFCCFLKRSLLWLLAAGNSVRTEAGRPVKRWPH